MKQFLLVISFLLFVSIGYSQTSFSDRLAFNPPKKEKVDVKVFPNPAEDFIKVTSDKRIRKVEIYNLVGRVVKSYAYRPNQQYAISDLPKGVYLIRIVGANDKVLVTRRVSKR